MDPDPTLNFKVGETIYENYKVVEWTRFWKAAIASTLGFAPGFYLFETYAADGMPSLDWAGSNFNWWTIPKQFQDGSGWGLEAMRYCDDHDYMNFQYGGKRLFARPAHTAYVMTVLILLQNANFDYVSKMIYNKDKDLVFVYKPDGFWGEREYVYEMHHLEQMVPFAVKAIENHSTMKEDSIITVYDMHTRDNLKLHNDSKYWNLDLKDEFVAETTGLWRGNFDCKYNGSIFKLNGGKVNEEEQLSIMKVDRELQDAVAKHGEVETPKRYEEEMREEIERRKK